MSVHSNLNEIFHKYSNTGVITLLGNMEKNNELSSINILQDAIHLSTFPEFTAYPLKPTSYYIDVKLTAPPFSQNEVARAPIDLVAVIDRSGSMNGEKLELIKQVLHYVVSLLNSSDRLGIVTYDGSVEETAPLTKVSQKNRTHLDGSIDNVYSGGSTNLSGGLLKGMMMMKERTGEMPDVASVLLFTDGIANFGITDTNTIITVMNNLYGETKNFTVNTFGFGSDHNVEMLTAISRAGNGLFYFIQSTDQMSEIFSNYLGGLLSTVAQNISVSIETCQGALVKEIFSKVKPTLSGGNKKGTVVMGDLQSEEENDLLVKLSLPEISESVSRFNSPNVYAKISLNYFNVIKKSMDSVHTEVSVPRVNVPGELTSSVEVDEQRNRMNFIESLTKAAEMAEKGRLEEARKVLTSSQQIINASFSCKSDKVTSLNDDLSSAMIGLSDTNAFQNYGKSTFATLEDSHSSQRSTSLRSRSYTTRSRSMTYHGYVNTQEEFNMQAEPDANVRIPESGTKPFSPRGRSCSLVTTSETSNPKNKECKTPGASTYLPFISEL